MKLLSKIGIISGIIIITSSIVRWFFMYPDNSNLIFGIGLGCCVCGFGLFYNWMKDVEKGFKDMDKRYDAMYKWFERKEWE